MLHSGYSDRCSSHKGRWRGQSFISFLLVTNSVIGIIASPHLADTGLRTSYKNSFKGSEVSRANSKLRAAVTQVGLLTGLPKFSKSNPVVVNFLTVWQVCPGYSNSMQSN